MPSIHILQMKAQKDLDLKALELGSPGSKFDESRVIVEPALESPITPSIEDDVPPDGGLRACLCTMGGSLIQFCTFGYSSSFGVYEAYYVEEAGFSSSDTSWIGSIQLFLIFFMGLAAGRLFDAGYFRYLQVTGSFLYVLSLFMLSLADPNKYYQLLLAQGIGMGLGAGLLSPPPSRSSHSSCGGGIVYPIMVNQLISHPKIGFAWAVRATGFLTLGLLCVAGVLMRPRRARGWREIARPRTGLLDIIQDDVYIITVSGVFLVILSMFFPYFYLQLWAESHGIPTSFTTYTIALINAGSLFGRLIPNSLADRIGPFNVFCPAAFITGALAFMMFGATSIGVDTLFAILFGFFSGAFAAMIAPTMASLAQNPAEMGIRIGFGYSIMGFGMLAGSPVEGAILGSQRRWSRSIVFCGGMITAGALVIAAARLTHRRKHNMALWGKM